MEVENIQTNGDINIKAETFESEIKAIEIVNKQGIPEMYNEIHTCYTKKDYEKCLSYIDQVSEYIVEYQILKSACLIHLGTKVSEAHKILDEILHKEPNNAYTIYAKGLAFYHEEKWEESVGYFEQARNLDSSKDMIRAEIMMGKARAMMVDIKSETIKQEPSDAPFKQSSHYSSSPRRRFGCDLCNHFFGKKFNLDRHNRTLHKRSTPADFPTSEKIKSSTVAKVLPVVRAKPTAKPHYFKIGNLPVGKRGKVKCPTCKKLFKKGSIARHIIIHSGNKPHKCNQCSMAFFQKSDLTRHLATHSDELNFACDQCERKFRIKKNLQVHKRRHHSKNQ